MMELLTNESNTGQNRRFIRDGIAGNYDIVYAMIRITRQSVLYDKGLKDFASNLLSLNGLDAFDQKEALQTIYDFVAKSQTVRISENPNTLNKAIAYILDQAGNIESIKGARATLIDGYGDCDDLTILIATLLGCLGYEDVKICLASYNANDTAFSHVYPVVYLEGKRFVLDAGLDNPKFNSEIKPFSVKEISIFGDVIGLDGIGGVYQNLKYYTRQVSQSALKVLPKLGGVLPVGYAASALFSTGASMLNQTNTQTLSSNATASKINQELSQVILALQQNRISYDVAKSYASQVAVQFGVAQNRDENYEVLKNTITQKLNYIANYGKENETVELNPSLMLIAGAGLTGFVGYQLYKTYFRGY